MLTSVILDSVHVGLENFGINIWWEEGLDDHCRYWTAEVELEESIHNWGQEGQDSSVGWQGCDVKQNSLNKLEGPTSDYVVEHVHEPVSRFCHFVI